mgnify:CR=1 FL=1
MAKVLVLYYSSYGHIMKMAEAVAEGARGAGAGEHLLTDRVLSLRARLHDGDLAPEAIPVIIGGLAHLDIADRQTADQQLCADPATLALEAVLASDTPARATGTTRGFVVFLC